jgi:ech hydrogenase subunit F
MRHMFNRILKNFFGRPATRLYPASVREPFERTRGRINFQQDTCIYCGICQKKCPADAIKVDRLNTTWELNAFRCIICGECVNACPKKSITMTNERRQSAKTKEIITVKRDAK